jgi:hypothetical protein
VTSSLSASNYFFFHPNATATALTNKTVAARCVGLHTVSFNGFSPFQLPD